MSNTTRTRKTRATSAATGTTGSARTPRPDPAPNADAVAVAVVVGRTDTEDRLWRALHADPNSTATQLCTEAGIGKSTAQKILARWAGEGSVTRTAGIADGGRRAADLWAITDTADVDTPADVERDTADGVAPVDHPAPLDTTQAAPDTPEATDAVPADGAHTDDTEPTDPVSADTEPDTDAAQDAPGTAAPELAVDAEPDAKAAEPTVEGAVSAATADNGGGAKVTRLAPGALRGMVEDHLRDHPGQECSPVEIARVLGGKSTGAVSNALDKLVKNKIAVQTKDRPRRYALAASEATTASA